MVMSLQHIWSPEKYVQMFIHTTVVCKEALLVQMSPYNLYYCKTFWRTIVWSTYSLNNMHYRIAHMYKHVLIV